MSKRCNQQVTVSAHSLPCPLVHEHIFPLLSSEHMTATSNCTSGLLVQLISMTKNKAKNSFKVLMHVIREYDDKKLIIQLGMPYCTKMHRDNTI